MHVCACSACSACHHEHTIHTVALETDRAQNSFLRPTGGGDAVVAREVWEESRRAHGGRTQDL